MRNFHELQVWIKSHSLTLKIYKATNSFPKEEIFGLTNQMRSSSTSIPTNIAEGNGRRTNPDFKPFLTIANGSCSELDYQLLLASDLLYLSESIFSELTENVIEIRKMINSLSNKLN